MTSLGMHRPDHRAQQSERTESTVINMVITLKTGCGQFASFLFSERIIISTKFKGHKKWFVEAEAFYRQHALTYP